jgi:hypothetical protein
LSLHSLSIETDDENNAGQTYTLTITISLDDYAIDYARIATYTVAVTINDCIVTSTDWTTGLIVDKYFDIKTTLAPFSFLDPEVTPCDYYVWTCGYSSTPAIPTELNVVFDDSTNTFTITTMDTAARGIYDITVTCDLNDGDATQEVQTFELEVDACKYDTVTFTAPGTADFVYELVNDGVVTLNSPSDFAQAFTECDFGYTLTWLSGDGDVEPAGASIDASTGEVSVSFSDLNLHDQRHNYRITATSSESEEADNTKSDDFEIWFKDPCTY